MQIGDAGFNVGFLCAAFFASRDDRIEGVSHATKFSRRLFTCFLALQFPWQVRAIPEKKLPKTTRCAVELVLIIRIRHRRPSPYS